jgi:hypothetical protein
MFSFLYDVKFPFYSTNYQKKYNIDSYLYNNNIKSMNQKNYHLLSQEWKDRITPVRIENAESNRSIPKIYFSKKLENVYPLNNEKPDKIDLCINQKLLEIIKANKKKTPSFSLKHIYDFGYSVCKNISYYSYLGLFTGILILLIKREKERTIKWTNLRFFIKNE